MKFSIIIPNYNSEKWIVKCLDSIKNQTFKDYEVIIIDDISTDNSVEVIEEYIRKLKGFWLYENEIKRWNGGSRNVGVEKAIGEYILFIDCDDWFYSESCLEEIAKVIDENNKPDCIRLPYHFITHWGGQAMMLHEKNLKELADTIFVAPWTKCIKRSLFIPFPENTLIEDVVQHIAQIDNIETLAYCNIPIVEWNRMNTGAISAQNKKYNRDDKRFSSIYRNIADLLDLRCKHDYCEERRQFRINAYLDIVHNKKESSLVTTG